MPLFLVEEKLLPPPLFMLLWDFHMWLLLGGDNFLLFLVIGSFCLKVFNVIKCHSHSSKWLCNFTLYSDNTHHVDWSSHLTISCVVVDSPLLFCISFECTLLIAWNLLSSFIFIRVIGLYFIFVWCWGCRPVVERFPNICKCSWFDPWHHQNFYLLLDL